MRILVGLAMLAFGGYLVWSMIRDGLSESMFANVWGIGVAGLMILGGIAGLVKSSDGEDHDHP